MKSVFLQNINYGFFDGGGQSNFTGDCTVDLLPTDLVPPITDAMFFNIYTATWQQLVVGVNNTGIPPEYSAPYPRFSFEVRLSRLLIDYYKVPQYFHKWGFPGSQIESWLSSPNNLVKNTTSFNLAKSKLPYPAVLKAYIWIQGEGNVTNPSGYVASITNLIGQVRTTRGLPSLPFIIVSLSTQQIGLNAGQIVAFKAMQRTLATKVLELDDTTITTQTGGLTIPNVYFIDQNEPCLTFNQPGIVHYNEVGVDNIAKKLFKLIKTFY